MRTTPHLSTVTANTSTNLARPRLSAHFVKEVVAPPSNAVVAMDVTMADVTLEADLVVEDGSIIPTPSPSRVAVIAVAWQTIMPILAISS